MHACTTAKAETMQKPTAAPCSACIPRIKRASTPPPIASGTTVIAKATRCHMTNPQNARLRKPQHLTGSHRPNGVSFVRAGSDSLNPDGYASDRLQLVRGQNSSGQLWTWYKFDVSRLKAQSASRRKTPSSHSTTMAIIPAAIMAAIQRPLRVVNFLMAFFLPLPGE